MTTKEIIAFIVNEEIKTWFDLGLFIDRIKESRKIPVDIFSGNFKQFCDDLSHGSMAFITFQYSVDGVSIEIEKYAQAFRKSYNNVQIHYVTGKFYPESQKHIDERTIKHEITELQGFNDWKLYKDFYFTTLERGSLKYNQLITDFLKEVLIIIEKLGNYIESNNILLLYLVNICSNPGNISLALAVVLISELMDIPVINNNHDFYWEDGNNSAVKETKSLKSGARDFFFKNFHIGELFSLIEVLFPWESRSWINVNINKLQSKHLIEENGHNPANVTEIGTAVDTETYINISKRNKINAFYQFEQILSRYSGKLISYSVMDAIKNRLIDEKDPRPILIGNKTMPVDKFLNENIIFLQPTRIIARKRIELGFKLIKKLFNEYNIVQKLKETANLKVTLLVTGPIAHGHFEYFQKLLTSFSKLLNSLDPLYRKRFYLAFLFSELDKDHFKKKFVDPVGIPELFNIASLILLPSKTEGRGLPIIEAAACGTPVLCRRYLPENVYSEVIGEFLPEEDRLQVIEFNGKKITKSLVNKVVERVLFPHKYTEEIILNKKAVKKRFSLDKLTDDIKYLVFLLHHQISEDKKNHRKTVKTLAEYQNTFDSNNAGIKKIINDESRQYLPGFGKMAFMLNLKSLIDPSAFRKEEQQLKGYIHSYARTLVKARNNLYLKKHLNFFNAVDNVFYFRDGETSLRHDHSFAYRHRNKHHYPFRDFTPQELTGFVNMLYIKMLGKHAARRIDESSHFFTDWDLAIAQMTLSTNIGIDDRKILVHKLQENIPVGIFPGDYVKYELEFFALQAVRSRLSLNIEEELKEDIIQINKKDLAPIYVFAQTIPIGRWFNIEEIVEYIEKGTENELFMLYKHGILKIIGTNQWCLGIHFNQMGDDALDALNVIHMNNGFIISSRPEAVVMTDIVNIDKFHIGKAAHPITANILGIPVNSGYIQYVPAGLRATITYPTPVQTGKQFNETIKSQLFNELARNQGEKRLFNIIKDTSEKSGTTVLEILENLHTGTSKKDFIEYEYFCGKYDDGNPYSGVYARIRSDEEDILWKFKILSDVNHPKLVTDFIGQFEADTGISAQIAWNGGYILNAELVGKLGLPESYIGAPMGLVITDSKIICPPLFNKAGLIVNRKGNLDIRRTNIRKGIMIKHEEFTLRFEKENYNPDFITSDKPFYFDLMYSKDQICVKKSIVVRLAGNKVIDIIMPSGSEIVKMIPVGLTLVIPADIYPEMNISVGCELDIYIDEFEKVEYAVGAGPMLISNGKVDIDMETEGWTTKNSIKTQAARLDYLDMRGPKIAAGLDSSNNLYIVAVNGRIRESVGATHGDIANIMLKFDIEKAMGFDPGGSATLVANGKVLNISPYNRSYENNIYSLSPQPRAVSNAVIGYV